MANPKDAFGTDLNIDDAVEVIQDVKIGSQTLPKGTVLRGLRFWHNDAQVEFEAVQIGTERADRVIPTKYLKKL